MSVKTSCRFWNLRKYHGIDYQTIFYDVHGYIELTKYRHALLREYVIAFGKKEYEAAEKIISELINMGGTYWEYNERGHIYGIQGDCTRAILDYNEALKLNPQYGQAYNNRGAAYRLQGDYTRAILDYNEAIKIDPKYASAYYNRGLAHIIEDSPKRDVEQAKKDYLKAVELNSELGTPERRKPFEKYL